jgi:hypothetical protein
MFGFTAWPMGTHDALQTADITTQHRGLGVVPYDHLLAIPLQQARCSGGSIHGGMAILS